jgi:hypothetical protein
MIDRALLLLRDELTNYLVSIGDAGDVVVENVGLLETSNADNLNNSIIISLVNIEEESTLKNGKNSFVSGFDQTAQYFNLPVFLNLYVLFTANFPGGTPPNNGYVLALSRLSHVIRFFQARNNFSATDTTQLLPGLIDPSPDPDLLNLKLTLELYTMTFEQVNHLWGSLGGRQIPFVLYKLRLVALNGRRVLREVPLIEEIETNLSKIPGKC